MGTSISISIGISIGVGIFMCVCVFVWGVCVYVHTFEPCVEGWLAHSVEYERQLVF
jgi:hypothetical protein